MPKTYLLPSPEQEKAETARTSATQYFMLNSADRNQNSSPGVFQNNSVPWNKFQIQRPQALMEAYARRIKVVDIRFPWFIPNITKNNNTLWIRIDGTLHTLTFDVGFYTPAQLVDVLDTALGGITASQVQSEQVGISYNAGKYTYTLSSGTHTVILYDSDPNNFTIPNPKFYAQSSLFKTLGFYPAQSGMTIPEDQQLMGGPTNSSYTDYVDICSDKLMYYTDVKDSSSSNTATNPSVICRVFANSEVSLPDVPQGIPCTCTPFTIFRQFKNAKSIKWNPEAHLDWLDVYVYDQYGQLVPLPPYTIIQTDGSGNPFPVERDGYYPDFQITFLASED